MDYYQETSSHTITDSPMRVGCDSKVVLGHRIGSQVGSDVGVESLSVHDNARTECWNIGRSSSERRGELLFSKDRTTVLRIYSTVGVISLFGVDVPSSSQCVGFRAEPTGSEPNSQIELSEVFGPSRLSASEEFRGREILQVLVVGNNVDRGTGAFEVVTPSSEGLEDGQQLFVVYVIIKFGAREGSGMECDRMELAVLGVRGEDSC